MAEAVVMGVLHRGRKLIYRFVKNETFFESNVQAEPITRYL